MADASARENGVHIFNKKRYCECCGSNLTTGLSQNQDSTIPLVWSITSLHACDLDEDQESMHAHGITLIP